MTASVFVKATFQTGALTGLPSRVNSPFARYEKEPGRTSTKSGKGTLDAVGFNTFPGMKAAMAMGVTKAMAPNPSKFQTSCMGCSSRAACCQTDRFQRLHLRLKDSFR
jgi:hypothetical protein